MGGGGVGGGRTCIKGWVNAIVVHFTNVQQRVAGTDGSICNIVGRGPLPTKAGQEATTLSTGLV